MPKKPPLPPSPSQDERIVAALANVTIVLPFWGAIGAIVIWATQVDPSAELSPAFMLPMAIPFAILGPPFWAGSCS